MSSRLDEIKEELGDQMANWQERQGRRVYCDVTAVNLLPAVHALVKRHGARLITASGTDTRAALEILYHFSLDGEGTVISLRVSLPKSDPEIDSLSPFIRAAEWIEREIHEMLGVAFRGHPDPRRLLLADDWPEGNYPLRRDQEVQE